MDYNRKHDLTIDEIKESPVFKNLNEQELEQIRMTFIKMCEILMETMENNEGK